MQILIAGQPVPVSSIVCGSSYLVTRQWLLLRNPLTLISDDTSVPSEIVSGTGLRQPAKIVIHSPKRLRSDASFQACSGDTSEGTDTSTVAMGALYPMHGHR